MYRRGWETNSAGEFLERMSMLESGSSVLGPIWEQKIKNDCNLVLVKLTKILSLGVSSFLIQILWSKRTLEIVKSMSLKMLA